jgi:signal transduction histidine kinase
LVASAAALFLLTLLLALYELDRQRYMGAKREIITRDFYEIFRLPDDLNTYAWETLFGATADQRSAGRQRLESALRQIVDGPTSMYRFVLRDPAGAVVLDISNRAKRDRVNSFQNNLFLKNFEGVSDLRITRRPAREGEPRLVGRLVAHYTSPPGEPEILALTVRYRWYAAVLAAVWGALFLAFYRFVLRPMGEVTARLERARDGAVELIPQPASRLERSYNFLASQAVLHDVQQRFAALTGESEGAEPAAGERAAAALDIAGRAFGARQLVLAEVRRDGDETVVTGSLVWPARACAEAGTDAAILRALPAEAPAGEPRFVASPSGSGDFTFTAPLGAGMLLICGRLDAGRADVAFRMECLERACGAIYQGLSALRAYREAMARQRTEANMILSKNLGHDLTNIIATSKLDLLAIRQLLAAPDGAPDAARRDLLQQAVDGLLRSTKFLQEIVNIYRSFSYVRRPAYERHDVNGLIGEFLAAFEPTVSTRVAIERDLRAPGASLIVEPRLLKLALFNVLTNALDALKRRPPGDGAPPRVVVRTLAADDPAGAALRIEIEDNGPGIRDREGRLLARGEIDAIFEHGYSTKAEVSEGLGLNWVRTIIQDFHGGQVRAENVPGGGARFSMIIKSMETAEARMG